MTAVPLGETPSLCILCPPVRARIARSGGMTDWLCHERIEAHLGEIVQRYARLTARPGGGQDFGRRAPGYHSRPPVNMQAAALRDPRTAPTTVGEPHSPLNLFITWAGWMREERGQTGAIYPSGAGDLVVLDLEWRYLSTAMDWITRQPWVVRFDEQVRAVVSQMRSATHERNPRPVGWCTRDHGDDSAYPLFPPKLGTLDIVCGACGARYEPLDQIRMVHQSQAACDGCGHASGQHDNDSKARSCNMDWCDCTGFREVHP